MPSEAPAPPTGMCEKQDKSAQHTSKQQIKTGTKPKVTKKPKQVNSAAQSKTKKAEQARVAAAEKARAKISKAKVADLEKHNTRNLYFYHSGGNWYKGIGMTALIYNFWAKPRNRDTFTSTLMPDTDGHNISSEGVISIANMPKTEKALLKLGFTKQQSRDPEIIWYRVPKNFCPTKLREWMGEQEQKKQDLNEVIMVAGSDPALAAAIREFSLLLYNKIKNVNRVTQELVGKHLLDEGRQLFVTYRSWAIGDLGTKQGLNKMRECIDLIESDLLFLMDTQSGLTIDAIAKISFKAEEIRAILKKRLVELQKMESSKATTN